MRPTVTLVQLFAIFLPSLAKDSGILSAIPDSTVIIDQVNAPSIFVPVGPNNVTDMVLRDQQPWILYFHEGLIYEPFRDTADSFRGLIRFGLVHRDDTATARMIKFNSDSAAIFLTLPFGSEADKLSGSLATNILDTAVEHASSSVPDDSIARLETPESLTRLIRDGADATPSKFTAIFTVRDRTPTLMHRVLSKKLSAVYNFGLVPRAKSEAPLSGIGLSGVPAAVPGLLIMQPKLDGSGFEISRLDESEIATEDALLYWEALRYLIEYNRRFRAELPGDNQANDKAIVQLNELLRRESLTFRVIDWADLMRRQRNLESVDAAYSAAGDEL